MGTGGGLILKKLALIKLFTYTLKRIPVDLLFLIILFLDSYLVYSLLWIIITVCDQHLYYSLSGKYNS